MAENNYEDNKNVIRGKIYKILDLKDDYDSDYRKREVLIEYNTREYNGKKYSDIVKMKAERKAIDQLSMFSVGDEVEVGWVLTGSMWTPPDKDEEINITSAKILWMSNLSVQPKTEGEAVDDQVDEIMNNSPDDLPF